MRDLSLSAKTRGQDGISRKRELTKLQHRRQCVVLTLAQKGLEALLCEKLPALVRHQAVL